MRPITSCRVVKQTVVLAVFALTVILLSAGDHLTENVMICHMEAYHNCVLSRTPLASGNSCKVSSLIDVFSQAHR